MSSWPEGMTIYGELWEQRRACQRTHTETALLTYDAPGDQLLLTTDEAVGLAALCLRGCQAFFHPQMQRSLGLYLITESCFVSR